MAVDDKPVWLTIERTTAIYGLARMTQYDLIKEGRLISTVVKNRRYNKVESLEKLFGGQEGG